MSENQEKSGLNLLRIIGKRKWIIIIVCLLVIAGGATFAFTAKKLYLSSLSATTFLVENFKIEKGVEYLNLHIENDDYEGLAEELMIDQQVAEELVSISLVKPLNNNYQYDLEITVTDTGAIRELFSGILYFIDHMEYTSKRRNLESDKLNAIITTAEKEFEDLQSVQDKLGSGEGLLMYPSNLHKEAVEITENAESKKVDLELLSVVEVISPFYIPQKHFFPNKPLILLISLFAGIFLGIGSAVVLEMVEVLRRS